MYVAGYRATKVRPDPFLEFCLGWIDRNPVDTHGREAPIVWDSGQFHQQDGHVTAILDLELGHIGDPMMDLAAFRMRDTVLGFGDMNVLYDQYAKHTGAPVDLAAIMHHHFVFALTNQLVFHAALAAPPAASDYMTNMQWASETNLFALEGLAEIMGVDELDTVEMPDPRDSPVANAHEHLVRSLRSLDARRRVRAPPAAHRVPTRAAPAAVRRDRRRVHRGRPRRSPAVPPAAARDVAGGRRRAGGVRARRRRRPRRGAAAALPPSVPPLQAAVRSRGFGHGPARTHPEVSVLDDFSRGPHRGLTLRAQGEGAQQDPHRIEARMTAVREPARYRRFRLIRGGERGHDHVIADPPPKLVLLSPASARWLPSLTEALGPSYRVVTESHRDARPRSSSTAATTSSCSLIQDQRSTTRVIVVHTGHPSEQPMAPSELLDLGADTYLAPVSLPALAAHLKALTRSWDAFPPRPAARAG